MRKFLSLLVVIAVALTLASCGNSENKDDTDDGSGGSGGNAIKVVGDFGEKPKITHGDGDPSKKLETKVLKDGTGTVVQAGDVITADYQGQIWRNNDVFDNSYDRGAPARFPIGTGGVIQGWDDGLVGKKLGSRVVLSIPSDKGYQKDGNPQAGIKGTDTLVFVVDLVALVNNKTMLHGTPVKQPGGDVTVSGPLNAEPKVTVAKGAKAPAKPGKPVVIAKGKGKVIKAGDRLTSRFVVYDYSGKKVESSWDSQGGKPASPSVDLQVGPISGQAGPVDGLAGLKVGTRVRVDLAPQKDQSGKMQHAFVVIDVLDAYAQ